VHFHTFFLFDESSSTGYNDRILRLYSSARRLLEHAIEIERNSGAFFRYCSFHIYQMFLCGAFVLLKTLRNGYFAALVDVADGIALFNSATAALRQISCRNNDLPGRLSDVLSYLWNLNPRIVCGQGQDGLQLKIQSRMSMSIVYDSLWLWRNQFVANGNTGAISYPGMDDREGSIRLTTSDGRPNEEEAATPGIFQFEDINALPTDDLFFDWFR
jgi:transcriptional regulatory protein LEU3